MTSSFVGDTFFGLDLKIIKAKWHGFRRSVSKRILLIDFDATSLTLAEAQVQESAVSFEHIRRLPLPEEALERGTPAEPRKMASLIRAFCEENQIPAHRAAVVIPHDAVFTTLLSLPSSITPDNALEYVLDPTSAAQVPVQLDQMDADLIPLAIPGGLSGTQYYFLIAIPKKLVDRVVETLHYAGMDLLQLQAGISAQLQHCARYLQAVSPHRFVLHLDMQRDCTLAALLIDSGPFRMARLTSIRDFPELPDRKGTASDSPLINAEAQIIADDSYLPLSDLDLRRLSQEIKQFIKSCLDEYPHFQVESVLLAGVNSAHPLIDRMLHDLLKLKVHIIRPLATPGVGGVEPDAPLILQGLGRLIGAGLSFLPPTIRKSSDPSNDELMLLKALPDLPPEEPAPTASKLAEQNEFLSFTGGVSLELQDSASSQDCLDLNSDHECEQEESVFNQLTSEGKELDQPNEPAHSFSEEKLVPERSQDSPLFSMDSASKSAVESFDSIRVSPQVQEPSKSDISIHLEEDQDEVPFSMQDLMNSFEMKGIDCDESLSEDAMLLADEVEANPESVHLVDDPSLWPSISQSPNNSEADFKD